MRISRAATGGGPRLQLDRSVVPAILSTAGLVVAAVLSFNLLGGRLDLPLPGGGPVGGPARTPNPSVVYTPPPEQRTEVRGTILFAKAGAIWAASGTQVTRLDGAGHDSSPVWAPNGSTIYFIETRTTNGRAPFQGKDNTYTLDYPVVMRMGPDGGGRTLVHNGLFKLGGNDPRRQFFSWLVQPAVRPDGKLLALVSDAPQPFRTDVTLSLLPTAGGQVTNLGLPETGSLGHNDPAWSPDGRRIVYTHNVSQAGVGTPRIALYDVTTKRQRMLSQPGFAQPSYSPDGRYLVAVRTDGRGRDLVILDASNGSLVSRLTTDGGSTAPVWSPDGRQVAFLRVDGQDIDLHVLTLSTNGAFSVTEDKAVTTDSQLDGTSRPSWFMPPEMRASPSPSGSASPSTTP